MIPATPRTPVDGSARAQLRRWRDTVALITALSIVLFVLVVALGIPWIPCALIALAAVFGIGEVIRLTRKLAQSGS